MDAKSLSHFLRIFIAVQKPASNAVVTHVARKYDLVYKFANGSGDSKPRIFAKLRDMYSHSSVMTTVCQVVSLLDSRDERSRRYGGPCFSPLHSISILVVANAKVSGR